MKLFKTALPAALLAGCVLFLCACAAPAESTPAPSETGSSAPASTPAPQTETVIETGAYVFPGGARNASEYFTVEELDLPDTINGMDYWFYDFIDESVLLVQLTDARNNIPEQREFGALNILTGEYKTLFSVPEGESYGLSCTDGRYAVCSRHDEASGDYFIRLFDLSTGEGRDIYTYAPVYKGINVPLGPRVLLDGCLYFSDAMPGEDATGRMQLLCYNIGTGDLSTVAENASCPVVVDGQLAWMVGPDEQGNYALAGADGETTPLEERPISLTAAGGKLYSLRWREPGELFTIRYLAELETGRSLMETVMSVDQLRGGSLALTWYNYDEEVPALWLPDEGCVAVFSGLDKAYNSFRLGEDEIFLHCGHDNAPSRYYRILPK